jgi:Raf kinase inhibitor-like YbhB/YbcL family protein
MVKEAAMQLRSSAFANGERILIKYTGDGDDVSPPMEWSGALLATQAFALICDDPDAPTAQPWVHWVLYRIASDASSLPEGLSRSAKTTAAEGKNSWTSGQTLGYRGPAPPRRHGVHHYHFRLYALDALSLPPHLDKEALLHAIQGNVLCEAELVGWYERK